MAYEMGYNDIILLSAIFGMRQNMATSIQDEITVIVDADKFGQALTYYVNFYTEEIVYNTENYGISWGDGTFTTFDYTEVNNHLGEVVKLEYHHVYPNNIKYTMTLFGARTPDTSKITSYDNNKVPGECAVVNTVSATMNVTPLTDNYGYSGDEAAVVNTVSATLSVITMFDWYRYADDEAAVVNTVSATMNVTPLTDKYGYSGDEAVVVNTVSATFTVTTV